MATKTNKFELSSGNKYHIIYKVRGPINGFQNNTISDINEEQPNKHKKKIDCITHAISIFIKISNKKNNKPNGPNYRWNRALL